MFILMRALGKWPYILVFILLCFFVFIFKRLLRRLLARWEETLINSRCNSGMNVKSNFLGSRVATGFCLFVCWHTVGLVHHYPWCNDTLSVSLRILAIVGPSEPQRQWLLAQQLLTKTHIIKYNQFSMIFI